MTFVSRVLQHAAFFIAVAVTSTTLHAQTLSPEQARIVVGPFYQALTAESGRDASALVLQATSAEWVSCGGNDNCAPRERVAQGIAGLVKAVPDLKWEIKEVVVAGNRVIVRGEATGTPAGVLRGVPHGGKSMKFMSIDIHTIKDGKMTHSYHVEDWAGGLAQLAVK